MLQVAKLPQDFASQAAIAHEPVHLAIHNAKRVQQILDSTKYTFIAHEAVELKTKHPPLQGMYL